MLEQIGRGGMGVVYKAVQLALGRVVALKMLHAGGCTASELARFYAEAEVVARLQHPNIVHIHEVGLCPSGPFFVLEFASGGSLSARLAGMPQSSLTVAHLGRTIALAIQHAHDAGIIHRDLKPSNILLVEDARTPLERCTPKVSDFGLARLIEGERQLTLTGQTVGTPGYLPPEQARGPAKAVGPRADVYSLGVLLYEMLTGRPPFRGVTGLETIQLMLDQEPTPPSRLRRDLPRDLETVCLKCMEKDPARRYATAQALADDLDRFLRGEPVKARPARPHEVLWRLVKKNPRFSAAIATVALVLMLAFAMVVWQWRRAESAHALSEVRRLQAEKFAESEALARSEAQRLSDRLLLTRGVRLCEDGAIGEGLLWLTEALEKAAPGAENPRRSLRLLLAGWSGQLHTLRSYQRHHGTIGVSHVAWGEKCIVSAVGPCVHFWDADRGQPACQPLTLPGDVVALCLVGRKHIAAVREPTVVRLYSLPDGSPVGSPLPTPWRARCVAVSSDGYLALIGGSDGNAHLFRVRDGILVGRAWPHAGSVRTAAFGPDGNTAVTGCDDGVARIWDVATGRLTHTLSAHKWPVTAVAISSDGKLILTGGEDHKVCLWRQHDGALIATHKQENAIWTVAFSPDGRLFASGSQDDVARLWRVSDTKRLGANLLHLDPVRGVAFSPDGRSLVTGSEDGTMRVWDLSQAILPAFTMQHRKSVRAIACSPSGETLVTCSQDGILRKWEVATGMAQPFGGRVEHIGTHFALGYSPDGKLIAAGNDSEQVYLYDAQTLSAMGKPMKHGARVLSLAFSHDCKFLATGCDDGDRIIRVWDHQAGVVVRQFRGHSRKVSSLAFSPDDRYLLSGSWDYNARLWDMATGQQHGADLAHQDLVQSVAFASPKVALSCGDDFTMRLWDVESAKQLTYPLRHFDKVQAVACSPDGLVMATGGKAGEVRLFDRHTGKCLMPPLPHDGEVHSLAFDPCGRWLWTGSWDSTVKRRAVPRPLPGSTNEIRAWIEAQTGRRLDPSGVATTLSLEEWEQRIKATRPR